MPVKDLLKQFKAASWGSPEEAEAFVLEAGAVPPSELTKLLDVLTATRGPGDAQAHHNRCVVFARLADQSPSEELFVPYLRALKAPDPQVRQLLTAALPKCNSVPAHPELCQVLRSADVDQRRAASHVLRQVAGKTAFELLGKMVAEPELPGRLEALDILVAKGAHHAIPALAAALAVGKPMERAQALKYLGDARAMAKDLAGALAAIATALADADERVAAQAIASFSALCTEDDWFTHVAPSLDASSQNVARAAIEGLRRWDSPRSVAALDRKFRAGPAALRMAVLAVAEAIGSDSVLPVLVQALHHKQAALRNRGAEILSQLATTKKVDLARTVLWLLRSRDVNVRRLAVEIVKRVGDPSGELGPKLLRFLRDEDWWVRERVTDALVEMAGGTLTRHVVGFLQDPSDVVRRWAVDVLLRLKDPQSLGALVRSAMQDTDWWVRERAIEVIGVLGDARAVPYVVDLLKREADLRMSCLAALTELGATAAAPHVAALLGETDLDLRLAALHCLAKLDDRTQAPAVQACADEPDHRLRNAARELLATWELSRGDGSSAVDRGLSLLDRLLVGLSRAEGDDLILVANGKPFMKRHGVTSPIANTVLSSEQVEAILLPLLNDGQRQDLESLRDVDLSYEVKTEGLRFRANLFHQFAGMSAVFRIIKGKLPILEELGLPDVVRTFGDLKNGLVLVGGPTGSGKSSTLAGIIDYVNRTYARHIITLEDPIEVVHARKKCLVNQREIGAHTRSFASALRSTLREDPDVILVGEMRDLPTIQFAVSAAETGHLVFGTLHTVSADTTVDRLVGAFPPGQQPQVRSMLAETLRAVVCQHLFRRKDTPGRVLAVEVMLNNDAISNMIRKGKSFQIPTVIATSREQGMQTMDAEIVRLVKEGKIDVDEAYMKANDKKAFEQAAGLDAGTKGAQPRPPGAGAQPATTAQRTPGRPTAS